VSALAGTAELKKGRTHMRAAAQTTRNRLILFTSISSLAEGPRTGE
jgi:hypothetical protein